MFFVEKHYLPHAPSSLSPRTLQPWDEASLAPGMWHQLRSLWPEGKRVSIFFFIFSVFILPFELEYIGEFQSCFPPPPLFKYCNWFISTDMYTCFGGVLFHIGDDRVFGMFPCVTQWVLVTYFINNSVHMGWSSSFLPAPHVTFLATGSPFSKSVRLCLFLKEAHLYPSLDDTSMWYYMIHVSLCPLLQLKWSCLLLWMDLAL